MRYQAQGAFFVAIMLLGAVLIIPRDIQAATAAELNSQVQSSLKRLYAESPQAVELSKKAKGILVFPEILKAGFVVGGQGGEGALLKNGTVAGYYNTIQASVGLQIGMQKYGYALFFMTDEALSWLDKSAGWEIGTGPSIVVADSGAATSASTTTLQSDIYAFFFDMRGLMGGVGLQGTKITRVSK